MILLDSWFYNYEAVLPHLNQNNNLIVFYIDYKNHQKFSFLCYEDDGEVYRLVSSIGSKKDSSIMHYYSIAQIMDLDGDNKKELIVRDIQYGTAAVERYKIYKQKNDDYQLITSES